MQALAVRRRPRPTADAAQKDPGLQNHAKPRQCGTVSSATFTASMAPWQQLWHLNGSPPLSVLEMLHSEHELEQSQATLRLASILFIHARYGSPRGVRLP